MSYKARTLFSLIDDINKTLFLPHIQRPFVWKEEQMLKLFDSLMLGYPIQTFLFWKTKDAIKARRFMDSIEGDAELSQFYDKNVSKADVPKTFVLDGQQRLQTLYALFNGAVKSADEKQDLEAYIDITSGGTLLDDSLKYKLEFLPVNPGLPMYRLSNLRTCDQQRNAFEIAEEINESLSKMRTESSEERKASERQVLWNCTQIISLLREEIHFWIKELDGIANKYPYKKVLNIFVRVNSGGTKLDASDLMFAAMKESWSDVEANIENVVTMLNGAQKLEFDKTFVLKCLSLVHGHGAELRPESLAAEEGQQLLDVIEEKWDYTQEVFQQLRDFIQSDLQLYADKVIRSYASFIPLFDYLFHNPKPTPENKVLMKAYYYKSQLFNWYASQTDNTLNALHFRLGKPSDSFPMEAVKVYFRDSRRVVTELSDDHLRDMRLRYIVLNLIYVERMGKSPFDVQFKGNEPHIDHIYPQSKLRSLLELETSDINHIGNYRFFGATDNIRKRAEAPDSYFPRLKKAGVNIDNHLLLPDYSNHPEKLSMTRNTYIDFRDKRFEAVYEICRDVVNAELAVAEA